MKDALLFLILITLGTYSYANPQDAPQGGTAAAEDNEAYREAMDYQVSQVTYSDDFLYDLNLTAEGRGWSLADAKAQHMATKRLRETGDDLRAQIGDNYIAAALSDEPGGAPTIYVKGPLDETIRDSLPVGITIRDNLAHSLEEMKFHQRQVYALLVNQGYEQIVTSLDLGEQLITATVMRPATLQYMSEESLALSLPESLDNHVVIHIKDTPIVELFNSYGGMKITGSGGCTAGWIVKETGTGLKGVTTAGHCTGMNKASHQQGPSGHNHTAVIENAHEGQYGDISWYQTVADEYAYFYFDTESLGNFLREVFSVKPVSQMVIGETVCVYGRSSDERDCTLTIETLSITCSTIQNMVGMDGLGVTQAGDSGGGWSHTNAAYGSVVGSCNGKAVWTPASLFDDAIGVTVMTR